MNFDQAFDVLMQREGGYTVDSGGPTMYGVTEAVARANGYTGDMRDLPLPFAKHIAWESYWLTAHCDQAPDACRYDLFDAAYNQGPVTAVRLLQEAIGGITVDGDFGPLTMRAASKMDPQLLSKRFNAHRILSYTGDAGFSIDGRGWMNRVAANMLMEAS